MRERIHFSVAEHWLTGLCHRRSRGDRTSRRVWCSHVWSAPSYGHHVRTRDRLLTTPGMQRRKKKQKSAFRSSLSLDKRGPHTCSAPFWRMTHGRKLCYHWTNVVSRQWPPPSVFSCERCQLEQPSERGLNTLKFVGRQRSQFSFQTREGNGLDLL
jgi:hypothetical protein